MCISFRIDNKLDNKLYETCGELESLTNLEDCSYEPSIEAMKYYDKMDCLCNVDPQKVAKKLNMSYKMSDDYMEVEFEK